MAHVWFSHVGIQTYIRQRLAREVIQILGKAGTPEFSCID
jgi:hypothetical protein